MFVFAIERTQSNSALLNKKKNIAAGLQDHMDRRPLAKCFWTGETDLYGLNEKHLKENGTRALSYLWNMTVVVSLFQHVGLDRIPKHTCHSTNVRKEKSNFFGLPKSKFWP